VANQSFYEKMYDADLPGSPLMPDVLEMIKPLMHFMYEFESTGGKLLGLMITPKVFTVL